MAWRPLATWTLIKPSSVIGHWVAYQQNLCQIWEWAFLAPQHKIIMNASQIMVEFIPLKGPCQLKISTCHPPLQGLSQWPLQPLTFKTPWSEFRVEVKKETFIPWESLAEQALRWWEISEDFMSPIIISYHTQKITETLTVTYALAIKEKNAIKSQKWS